MNLLSNLQYTLHRIFEIYKAKGKSLISFTSVFVILTSIMSLIFALIVISIHSSFVSPSYPSTNGDSDFFNGIDFFIHLQSILLFLCIMNSGLYSICLRLFDSPKEKITFSNAFDGIKSEIWLAFFGYVTVGVIITFILNDLFVLNNPTSHYGLYASTLPINPWWQWIISIVQFIQFFLPFILLFFFTQFYLGKNEIKLERKSTMVRFLSVMLLSFTILLLGEKVYSVIQKFFIYPLSISFEDSLVLALISNVLYIFVIAQFYLGLSGAMVFPFLFQQQSNKN